MDTVAVALRLTLLTLALELLAALLASLVSLLCSLVLSLLALLAPLLASLASLALVSLAPVDDATSSSIGCWRSTTSGRKMLSPAAAGVGGNSVAGAGRRLKCCRWPAGVTCTAPSVTMTSLPLQRA